MDDQQLSNPSSAVPAYAAKDAAAGNLNAGDADIKEPGAQDILFFNVMPKDTTQGAKMIEPEIKVQASEDKEAKPQRSFNVWLALKKYKPYIIIAVIIIIVAPLIYFLINKSGGASYQPENLLVAHPPAAANATPSAQPTAAAGNGFTTPQGWRDKYFPNCADLTICGDNADPDQDGLNNLQEYKLGTDPNNPDSDQDGIGDGDEVNVFGSNPLQTHTGGNPQFSDADYIKGGYSFTTGKKLTPQQIAAITAKMQTFGLHEPTLTTLGGILDSLYNFSAPGAPSSTPVSAAAPTPAQNATSTASTLDQSLSAKTSRDTQRSNTIKNIEIALVAYQADNNSYPPALDFNDMFSDIKPYLKVATDPNDPINQAPYVYSYQSNASSSDFTLTFYSEVAAAPISKDAADAIKDADNEQADINDNQRENDLEDLRSALLLYSNANIAGSQTYVFPTKAKYATALVPTYISAIPKDPGTGQDYDYEPSATFDAFTLKTILQDPPAGNTGYICNQVDDCTYY